MTVRQEKKRNNDTSKRGRGRGGRYNSSSTLSTTYNTSSSISNYGSSTHSSFGGGSSHGVSGIGINGTGGPTTTFSSFDNNNNMGADMSLNQDNLQVSDDQVPKDVNVKLQTEIVKILHSTQTNDKREVYKHCQDLEQLVTEYEDFYSRLSVNDRLRLAQSYFLLGSMYREKNSRNFAYSYVERALSTFRDCNGLALAAGYNIETNDDQSKLLRPSGGGNGNNTPNGNGNGNNGFLGVSPEDVGHFWPQIVEVYILGGHILLANAQYCDAKDMYQLAHNLAISIKTKATKTQITVSEALENLAVVSMYENKVDESIVYTKRILEILKVHNENIENLKNEGKNTDDLPEIIPLIKILNARAYYACCLTLSDKLKQKEEGHNEYNNVVNDAAKSFGTFDARTIGFYCYFGLHFVQIKDFQRAHKSIDHILSVDDIDNDNNDNSNNNNNNKDEREESKQQHGDKQGDKHRQFQHFEKRVVNDLLFDYFKTIIKINESPEEKSSDNNNNDNSNNNNNNHNKNVSTQPAKEWTIDEFMNKHNEWLKNNLEKIHKKQLKYADDINEHQFNEIAKRKQSNNSSNDTTNNSVNNNNTNNGDCNGNSTGFKCEDDEKPKENLISILILHIKMFILLKDRQYAKNILTDLLAENQERLNANSKYLENYLNYININDFPQEQLKKLIKLHEENTKQLNNESNQENNDSYQENDNDEDDDLNFNNDQQ